MLPASSSGKNSVARTFSRSRFSYKSIGKSKCRSIMPPACSRSIRSSTDSFSAVIALGRRKPQIRRTPMELKFECPTCGQHLSATPAQIGVTAPCPNCNAAVTVPARQDDDQAVFVLPTKLPFLTSHRKKILEAKVSEL